jgi:hypothetical protein
MYPKGAPPPEMFASVPELLKFVSY